MDDEPRTGFVWRLLVAGWRLLDAARRFAFNLLFLALLIALVAGAIAGRTTVPSPTALVIDPRGPIVEQLSGSPRDRLLANLTSQGSRPETLLKDLLRAVRAGKDDARVKALVLDLDGMGGCGMSALQDLRDALLDFKKSRKKVIAAADDYGQPQYYLAAHADEVFLSPLGMVRLEGFGGYRRHYKEGLDRFGIEMHVFRVGEYKSAVEPYLRKDMSPETKEALLDVYGDLWRSYVADVAAARKLTPGDLGGLLEDFPARVRAAGGDFARLAREAKLVDTVAPRDEVKKRLVALVGEDEETKSYPRVSFRDYLEAVGEDRGGRGDAVAVVVAKGDILDGSHPPGTIGGDSTAVLLRRAREDEKTKAVVLRVDSPGGSVYAADVIRRELELVRAGGKPVVVSMASLAASGGYWISTASDEIWAGPNTITGSIGVYGLFPNVHKPLATYLGVHVDGVGTTPLAGALRPDRPLVPEVGEVIQLAVDHVYEEFLARVAQARKMTREQADAVARGRVWSGEDAKRLGLVDHLGGLPQAVEAAAQRAKLAKGYRVVYLERKTGLRDRLLAGLLSRAASLARAVGWAGEPEPARRPPLERALRAVEDEAGRIARWNDPRGLYAHCLCGED